MKEQSIKEIFHSERLNDIRKNFRSGTYGALPPVCQNCKKTRLPKSSHRTLRGMYQKFLGYFQDQRSS